MRTTIDIPEPLILNAKSLAAARGTSVSGVIEDALRKLFSEKPLPAAPAFRLHTVSGRLVNPGLDLDRTSALIVTDDEETF